jgi:hypothetical protein
MQLNQNNLITFEKSVDLLPYKPREFIKRELMTDAEILANIGSDLFVDVECHPNYFLCAFKSPKLNKFIQLECGEGKSFNQQFLSWLLHNYRTIGFNSIKFDLLMIWLAYRNQDTYILKDATNDIILSEMRSQELKKKYGFFTYKTPHIDLIEVAPLKGSLKLYMARLHAPRIQELPIDHMKELTEEEIEIIKQYNANDLNGTELLFNFMKERLDLRQNMSIEYNEDLMSKSDAQIAEVVLAKEVGKINSSRPKRAEIDTGTIYRYSIPNYIEYQSTELKLMLGKIRVAKFIVNGFGKIDLPEELKTNVRIGTGSYRLGIGGLHSSEKNVRYISDNNNSIVDRDVVSYYPKIVTTLGLYPQSCGPAFLEVYNHIIDSRIAAKRAKRTTESAGKKIVINGAGGKFSDFWSILYAPDLTIQMTVTGQLALLMQIEMLELNSIQVISANTDGVVMIVRKDQEDTLKYVIKDWEQRTGFETEETRYVAYYARDVNAYFAIKVDGTVKKKGPYSEIGSQSGTKLDTNPMVLICSDAVEALLSKGIPIEHTIRECKDFTRFVTVRQVKGGAHKNKEYLGKVVRWAYIKGEAGTINYVTTGNKVADTDGAVPFMDFPNEWPDINYDWYIKKTNEILEEIGYHQRPKQLQFF